MEINKKFKTIFVKNITKQQIISKADENQTLSYQNQIIESNLMRTKKKCRENKSHFPTQESNSNFDNHLSVKSRVENQMLVT